MVMVISLQHSIEDIEGGDGAMPHTMQGGISLVLYCPKAALSLMKK
jgi:hypothetical protein